MRASDGQKMRSKHTTARPRFHPPALGVAFLLRACPAVANSALPFSAMGNLSRVDLRCCRSLRTHVPIARAVPFPRICAMHVRANYKLQTRESNAASHLFPPARLSPCLSLRVSPFAHARPVIMFPSLLTSSLRPSLFCPPQRWFKVVSALKRRCTSCRIVRRGKKIYNLCDANPRHKQRQGKKGSLYARS